MRNSILTNWEKKKIKFNKYPDFRVGDSIKVSYKIKEEATEDSKEKFRTQIFEGVVMRKRRGTTDASFTVRKISANGVGVERCFPMHSPFVEKVEVVARGVVRRARLYFLRDLAGKAARIRSQFGFTQEANALVSETKHEPQVPEAAAEPTAAQADETQTPN